MVFAVVFIDMYLGGGGVGRMIQGQARPHIVPGLGHQIGSYFVLALLNLVSLRNIAVQLTFYQVKEMIL